MAREGGFFQGWNSAVVASALQAFAYYFFFSVAKTVHGVRGAHSPRAALLTAAEAGLATVLLTNPIWEVNTRQATADPGSSKARRGAMEVLRELLAREGVAGLYTGLVPSLLLVLNPMAQFYSYELSLRVLSALTQPRGAKVAPWLLTPFGNFLIGAWAKSCATVMTYPVLTIRSVMIRNSDDGRVEGDKGRDQGSLAVAVRALQSIVHRDGVAGLYAGMWAKMLQSSLNAALLNVVRIRVISIFKQ